MPFDQATRNRLSSFVGEARSLLSDEFTRQFKQDYGLDPDRGEVTELDKLSHLDDARRETARILRDTLAHYEAGLPNQGSKARIEALRRIVREQAFTVLNRLCALRMAEARGLLIESIAKGSQSDGFQLYQKLAGTGLGELGDAYRSYIFSVFDEFAVDLPVLFDRFSPKGRLFPRKAVLTQLLDAINHAEIESLWAEDETIGWIYQYFNSSEERRQMRKASRSPRNTRELAVRNQFFTPRYVVEFLTDNTLGRIWYEMCKGDTVLKEGCHYLVRRPNEVFLAPGEEAPAESENETELTQEELLKLPVYIDHRSKKDPRDLRVLDPACGSGHFLLYAFDLLERIYEEAWDDPESPKSEVTGRTLREEFETLEDLRRVVPKLIIEHNLHGIDIDPRAVQIAALALWLRAQKAWKNLGLKPADRSKVTKSNIVTAEPMPGDEQMRREFTAGLKPRVLGQLVEVVFNRMALAGEAGSLLKIEEEIKDAIAEARRQWLEGARPEQQLLFPGMADPRPKQQEMRFDFEGVTEERFWGQAEDRILEALKDYAERVENGHAIRRRLFAEDAARGFAFIDLCRNQYDAILMNPPFGASSRKAKGYIEDRYPKTKGDVLANFIERTLDLLGKTGRIGAISSRTPFFLGSFETLRTEVLGKIGHVRLLADLGEGVLEAMVETAIYVMTGNRRGESEPLFFRLLIDDEKGELLKQLIQECLDARVSDRTFVINPRHFETLSGNPYAYWVSKATIEVLSRHPRIEGTKGAIRVGLQTSEDFRFLRLLWEVPPKMIVLGVQATENRSISQQCLHALSNGKHWAPYSKTDVATPWHSPITLVANWANGGIELKSFAVTKGYSPSRNVRSEAKYFRAGFSYMARSTRLVPYIIPAGVIPTAGRSQMFPNESAEYEALGICGSNIGSAVARFGGGSFARPMFQASMIQRLPACDFPEETLERIKEHVDVEVNKRRAVVQHYEPFQEFTLPAWIQTTEGAQTVWDVYSLFGRDLEYEIAQAFGLSSEQLVELERDIREAVSIRERLENVESDDASEDSSKDNQELTIELISETVEEKAVGLYGYAVGVALGRWDARIALEPSLAPTLPAPFDPLPVCPPGMLVGPDGLPAESGGIVSEEWLHARPHANTLLAEGAVQNPTIADSDYPLRISWDGILVDDPGFTGAQRQRDDIVRRVREVLDLIWKEKAHETEQEACNILGVKSLGEYFRKPSGFFKDHLKRYSKSRRKAPIYWPLSTASGSYTIWVYYHRLTDQILFTCVNDYLDPKLKQVTEYMGKLKQKGERNREDEREFEYLSDLELEMRDLREELLRIAAFWKPNLNDGVQITAAPLWKLFRHTPWQNTLKATWKKLEAGEYDWAHLAYSIWPDRVLEKCKSDKSLAIAHEMESIYEGN